VTFGRLLGYPEIRAAMIQGAGRRRVSPIAGPLLVVGLFLVYCVLFLLTVCEPKIWLKLLYAFMTGSAIGVLFVAGHDASHGCLSRSARRGRWLARLAFLPSLHPNETWTEGHNRQHHTWTNLSTKDTGYTPLTLEQYSALSAVQKLIIRFGSTPSGIWAAYMRIWWQNIIRVRRGRIHDANAYRLELASLAAFCIGQVAVALKFGGLAALGERYFAELLVSIVLPFLIWNWTMAFVTILQHSHPQVRWYDDEKEWTVFKGQVEGCVHIKWPVWFEYAFLNIFDHTAHHSDKSISLFHLKGAQAALEEAFSDSIVVCRGSFRHLLDVLRICRLYDYRAHRWRDWNGNVLADAGAPKSKYQKPAPNVNVNRPGKAGDSLV
jgi:omega-6 fatty acid desaturase (delta-12 desaturase)